MRRTSGQERITHALVGLTKRDQLSRLLDDRRFQSPPRPPSQRDEGAYRQYSTEKQRSQTGCSAARMQWDFHHGSRGCAASQSWARRWASTRHSGSGWTCSPVHGVADASQLIALIEDPVTRFGQRYRGERDLPERPRNRRWAARTAHGEFSRHIMMATGADGEPKRGARRWRPLGARPGVQCSRQPG